MRKITAILLVLLLCASIASASAEAYNQVIFMEPGDQLCEDAAALPDGGFLLSGSTVGVDDEPLAWLVRLDASGKLVWETTTGEGHARTRFGQISLMDDGSFAVMYHYLIDMNTYSRITHISAEGDILSSHDLSSDRANLGYRAHNGIISRTLKTDGRPPQREYTLLSCITPDGETIWETEDDTVSRMSLTTHPIADGGYLLAGSVEQDTASVAAYIARLDAQGGFIWSNTVPVQGDGSFIDAYLAEDGSVYACGDRYMWSDDGSTLTGLVTCVDKAGTERWTQQYAPEEGGLQWYGIAPMGGGVSLLMGNTVYQENCIYMMTIDADGNTLDTWTLTPQPDLEYYATRLLKTDHGHYGVFSIQDGLNAGFDVMLVQVDKPN